MADYWDPRGRAFIRWGMNQMTWNPSFGEQEEQTRLPSDAARVPADWALGEAAPRREISNSIS
jgi:hypothetical protein